MRKRRGPTATAPQLDHHARQQFFDNLREIAERSTALNGDGYGAGTLLRRQTYYIAAWDDSDATGRWLRHRQTDDLRRANVAQGWSPDWAAVRSLVVARARQGDPEPLRQFIATALTNEECEAASLNYWAYWIGEVAGAMHSDAFMAGDLGAWGGTTLLRRLCEQLSPDESTVDLYVHSIWALLQRRPSILRIDGRTAAELDNRIAVVAESGVLSTQARKEVDQIVYGARLARA